VRESHDQPYCEESDFVKIRTKGSRNTTNEQQHVGQQKRLKYKNCQFIYINELQFEALLVSGERLKRLAKLG
jgi:hypothetical protein